MSTPLHQQLVSLHEELARATHVDEQSKMLLVTLLGDITRLLESNGSERVSGTASLPERMEAVAVEFEAEHPSLSAAIRGVVEALSRAGI